MTTMPEPMTLEQVRDFLRAEYDMRVANRSASLHKTADFLRASDSIDAELAKQRNAEPVAWAIFSDATGEMDGEPTEFRKMLDEGNLLPGYSVHPLYRYPRQCNVELVNVLTDSEVEWLNYAIAHMLDDNEPEDKTCAEVLQHLLDRTHYPILRNASDTPIVREVLDEVIRATGKFPTWPNDPLHAMGVLHEEVGELAKAVLQQVYEPHKQNAGDVRKEAVQAAAMTLRFLASLDTYQFQPGVQHEQAFQA